MGKHWKISSSTEWRLEENFVLRPMECLALTVKFDIFITISHLFVCRPILELSTTDVFNKANALSLGTNSCKKSNVTTLNSAHQAKKQCNMGIS